ncbi:hypothetical protein JWJ88_14500 [Paracoccus methylovorus]|uniref:XRE family transcriptional regulator n=1 Tax=Paracoccus methylovorus TaxID=2812658 RepID=A0ABX7JNI4_9RHOB|nr:hypothetical protein [Paracoccus methylovorus]QRZ15546.1 hypothetical protein JWJ88_14500 [Paracoccus methylovorus]
MERWAFKTGCILMGWSPVEAAIELRTSIETITKLENGPLDEVLAGDVVGRAKSIFRGQKLAIYPRETGRNSPSTTKIQHIETRPRRP